MNFKGFIGIFAIFTIFTCYGVSNEPKKIQITAIDIVLEPDAKMVQRAIEVNKRLLKTYPDGFALDDKHHPHITLLQRYVRTEDLEKVYTVAAKVFAKFKVSEMKLEAFKFYYIPDKNIGIAGIVIEPTEDLFKLQQELIDAVAPYTVETGTATAFFTTPKEPDILQAVMDYVVAFVPNASGKHFNPHVTVGIATRKYLDAMLAEPFEAFTFSVVGASIYQLGNYGTAAKKLKELEIKP